MRKDRPTGTNKHDVRVAKINALRAVAVALITSTPVVVAVVFGATPWQ